MRYSCVKRFFFTFVFFVTSIFIALAQGPTTSLSNPSRLSSGGGGGAHINSVNLNTGEISFPVTLASIPGRNGLGAQVVANYNSRGVRESEKLDNVSSPTGVMGLGWSIGMDQITSNHKNTKNRNDDDFYLNGMKLIRTGGTTSVWEYKPVNYQNWIIKYYIDSDYWEVTKDDGTVCSYGVNDNSRQCMIVWGEQVHQNTGPSSIQDKFILSWFLEEKENVYGDKVTYKYRKESRSIYNITEEYDQEVRLLEISGNLGHKIIFGYAEKEDNEYEDPRW